ncbi:TPA: hypothetical protein ACH9PM_005771, partial [Escherichia coli]
INVHVKTFQTCFKNQQIRCIGNFGVSGVQPRLDINELTCVVYWSLPSPAMTQDFDIPSKK